METIKQTKMLLDQNHIRRVIANIDHTPSPVIQTRVMSFDLYTQI